ALVEAGHIYIAQPPLYKLKAGKHETYVKDDQELGEWLIGNALDGAQLSADGQPVDAARLVALVREYAAVAELIEKLARRYEQHVLDSLARLAPLPADATALAAW